MYCTPVETIKARIPHKCTNCGEPIEVGQQYKRWASFDDSCFTNKMHPECLDALQQDSDNGGFEYSLYGGERPILITQV